MLDYRLHHVEKYGHGKLESNELPDDKKVKIADHDGYIDVYECETDQEAQNIADWYLSVGYERYPVQVEIVKQNSRYFSIETVD